MPGATPPRESCTDPDEEPDALHGGAILLATGIKPPHA